MGRVHYPDVVSGLLRHEPHEGWTTEDLGEECRFGAVAWGHRGNEAD